MSERTIYCQFSGAVTLAQCAACYADLSKQEAFLKRYPKRLSCKMANIQPPPYEQVGGKVFITRNAK
jgi:hypothetical protein